MATLCDLLTSALEDVSLQDSCQSPADMSYLDAAINKTRAVIDRLLEYTRTLNGRRNGLLPISRLPPEILCRIFSESLISVYQPLRKPSASDFSFSQVCQHWRIVAIRDPTLWTCPLMSNPYMAQKMVSRARGQPLHVHAHFGTIVSNDTTTREIISKESLTLQELRISGLVWQFLLNSGASLGNTPLLKTLHLASSTAVAPTRLSCHSQWCPPHLVSLTLNRCMFSLDADIFQNLHSLSIDFDGWTNSSESDTSEIEQMLHMLQKNPGLHKLRLSNTLVHGYASPPYLGAAITFLHLEELEVRDDSHKVTAFLAGIYAPNLKTLIIDTKHPNWDFAETLLAVADQLRRFLCVDSEHSIHGIDCEAGGDSVTIVFKFSHGATPAHLGSQQFSRHFAFTYRCRQESAILDTYTLLDKLLAIDMPIDDIRTLHIRGLYGRSKDAISHFWLRISRLEALVTVILEESNVGGIFERLCDPVSFPALQSLTLSTIDMRSLRQLTSDRVWERCTQSIQIRASSGRPLPDVLLEYCIFDDAPNARSALASGNIRLMDPRDRFGNPIDI